MTRGNQREVDRQRAAKREQKSMPQREKDGLSKDQRMARDAAALQAKAAAKAAAKQGQGNK